MTVNHLKGQNKLSHDIDKSISQVHIISTCSQVKPTENLHRYQHDIVSTCSQLSPKTSTSDNTEQSSTSIKTTKIAKWLPAIHLFPDAPKDGQKQLGEDTGSTSGLRGDALSETTDQWWAPGRITDLKTHTHK